MPSQHKAGITDSELKNRMVFGETIRNMFGCVCYFVVEYDGVVVCGWRCSIG